MPVMILDDGAFADRMPTKNWLRGSRSLHDTIYGNHRNGASSLDNCSLELVRESHGLPLRIAFVTPKCPSALSRYAADLAGGL